MVAKCGEPERRSYLRRLAALGLPVSLAAAGETTSFSFRYDADGTGEMRVEAIGEPWSEGDEPERALRRVEWVHVAPLLRGDFPPEALERIARRRRVLLDGHGLVRARRLGPLALDGDFDRDAPPPRLDPQALGGGGARDPRRRRARGAARARRAGGGRDVRRRRLARPHARRRRARAGPTRARRPDRSGRRVLGRLPGRARRRAQADLRPARERSRLGPLNTVTGRTGP